MKMSCSICNCVFFRRTDSLDEVDSIYTHDLCEDCRESVLDSFAEMCDAHEQFESLEEYLTRTSSNEEEETSEDVFDIEELVSLEDFSDKEDFKTSGGYRKA